MRKNNKNITESVNCLESCKYQDNIVKNVKVLGITSKNGRVYPLEVMRKAAQKYEGKVVNLDHKTSGPRSVMDRFGCVKNIRVEEDGMYGDLEYNPKHPYAEAFKYFVENQPEAVGLSHAAVARTKMDNKSNMEIVENIIEVESVDLVATAATNKTLFESYEEIKMEKSMPNENEEDLKEHVEEVKEVNIVEEFVSKEHKTLESFNESVLNLLSSLCSDEDKVNKIKESFEKHNELFQEAVKPVVEEVVIVAEPEDDNQKKLLAEEYLRISDKIGHKLILEELDRYRLKDQTEKKINKVSEFCKKSGLNQNLITEAFVEIMVNTNEEKWVKLVEDRKAISSYKSPISHGTDVINKTPVLTVDELVKKLRS